jgi:hypothetical protein
MSRKTISGCTRLPDTVAKTRYDRASQRTILFAA